MKEVEIEGYKRIPLEILLNVTDFCDKNNIRYSLAYGTLLGAIRHKGYIPWDDDIDIVMPRQDYELFRKLYRSYKYPLIDLLLDDHYPSKVAKVYDASTVIYFQKTAKRKYGLFIDVFVLDNLPNDVTERDIWVKSIRKLQMINAFKNTNLNHFWSKSSFTRKLKILAAKLSLVSSKSVHKRIEKLFQKYNDSECEKLGCLMDIRNYKTFAFPNYYFSKLIDVEFEGYNFKATAYYDEILRIVYGDYMVLPPESARVAKHDLRAYYKD